MQKYVINLIKNEKNHFLLLKKLKNTESAQLCFWAPHLSESPWSGQHVCIKVGVCGCVGVKMCVRMGVCVWCACWCNGLNILIFSFKKKTIFPTRQDRTLTRSNVFVLKSRGSTLERRYAQNFISTKTF